MRTEADPRIDRVDDRKVNRFEHERKRDASEQVMTYYRLMPQPIGWSINNTRTIKVNHGQGVAHGDWTFTFSSRTIAA